MKRQAIISLSVLIGVFLIWVPQAKAEQIIYTQTDTSSTTPIRSNPGAGQISRGTFTITATTTVASSTPAIAGFYLKTNATSGTCNLTFEIRPQYPNGGFQYGSLVDDDDLSIWSLVARVPNDGQFHFVETRMGRTSGGSDQAGQMPPGTYYLYLSTTSGNPCQTYTTEVYVDQNGYIAGYISADGEIADFTAEDRTTRFIGSAFDPYDEDTVATGTPVNLTGYLYLNEDDMDGELLTDGWWIEARIRRDSDNQIAVANITLLDTVLRIDDDWVATYNSFSTSTTFTREGRYTVQWTLHRPSVWNSISSFFGLEAYFNAGVLAEYTTHVVAGELTAYDEYVNSFQEGVENSFASTTLSVLTDRLNTCNPLGNFSMMDCLAGLFTLDPQSSGAVIEQFRSLIATKAPMGYVTRLVDIITAQTATTSLPIISVTFPTGLPLAGKVLDFDFNQILADAGEIASSTLVSSSNPNENIWTVVMPFVNTVFYLLLFFLIINDITGMYRNKGHR